MTYRERNINDFQEAKRAREAKKSRFSPVGDIEPRDVEALWDGRLPVGASTLLTGRGGLGKSTLCAWVAAEASRGAFGRPLATVFLSAEDPVDSVLQARLRAAGADMRLVWAPRFGENRPNISSALLKEIGELTLPAPLGLVVFDGFIDFMIGLNPDHDMQVRPIFAMLEAWAQPRGVAVLGIVHPNKTDAAGIAGTRAFRDCSRSVLVSESHPLPNHPHRVLLLHNKHNWTAEAPMMAYEPGAGAVRWLPLAEEDAPSEDIVAAIRADIEGFKDAGEFLRHALANGPRGYAELVSEAGQFGIPARTLRYARKRLGVESSVKGFGEEKEAVWWLPGEHISPKSPAEKTVMPTGDKPAGTSMLAKFIRALDETPTDTNSPTHPLIPINAEVRRLDAVKGTLYVMCQASDNLWASALSTAIRRRVVASYGDWVWPIEE